MSILAETDGNDSFNGDAVYNIMIIIILLLSKV